MHTMPGRNILLFNSRIANGTDQLAQFSLLAALIDFSSFTQKI